MEIRISVLAISNSPSDQVIIPPPGFVRSAKRSKCDSEKREGGRIQDYTTENLNRRTRGRGRIIKWADFSKRLKLNADHSAIVNDKRGKEAIRKALAP